MRQKITKNVAATAVGKPGKLCFIWDTDQRGFGLQISSGGTKSYVFSYSLPGWRSPRRITIGRQVDLTLDLARARARALREQVTLGFDPMAIGEMQARKPTVQDLIERFLSDHVELKLRPKTQQAYRRTLVALPQTFRQLKADEVTGDHVARLHVAMRDRPYQANRTVAILRKMFRLAERWNSRPRGSNPGTGHDFYPERKDRGARFTDEQLAAVGLVIAELEQENLFNPLLLDLLRLNMFTGWRPIEVRELRWDDVDLSRRVVTLREAKTGTRSGFLGRPAAVILANLPRFLGNPYCFPGKERSKPLYDCKGLWRTLWKRAELPERLRPYDLVRHTFNTVAQEAGVPPEMVRVLVGHVPMTISARYTHFALRRTLEAADLASEAIERRLRGEVEPQPFFDWRATLNSPEPRAQHGLPFMLHGKLMLVE